MENYAKCENIKLWIFRKHKIVLVKQNKAVRQFIIIYI